LSNLPPEVPAGTTSRPQRSWHVRPFREEDLPGLLDLYRLVFGRVRNEEEFRWKLCGLESPVDTVWVAAEGNRIVGQHAGIPMRLRLLGENVFAMHAVEAMTHPEYRKQGMLTELGGGLYNHWRDKGVPLIMGLPHAGWGTRAYALGYRDSFPLRWLSRPIKPLSMLLSRLGRATGDRAGDPAAQVVQINSRNGFDISQLNRAGEEIDSLWANAGPEYENCVVRDRAWVQWRFLDIPGRPYTVLLAKRDDLPVGYITYSLMVAGSRRIGRIADVFAGANDAAASALLSAAVSDLRARGADSATLLVAVGSRLYATARSAGFFLKRGDYATSFIPLAEGVEMAAISNPALWHLTGGDFDVI
jgi:hypothetical protein